LLEKADFEEVQMLEAEEQAAAVAAGFGGGKGRSADSEVPVKAGAAAGEAGVSGIAVKSASKVASVYRAPKQASTIAAVWNLGGE
jgi:hypothetical protein